MARVHRFGSRFDHEQKDGLVRHPAQLESASSIQLRERAGQKKLCGRLSSSCVDTSCVGACVSIWMVIVSQFAESGRIRTGKSSGISPWKDDAEASISTGDFASQLGVPKGSARHWFSTKRPSGFQLCGHSNSRFSRVRSGSMPAIPGRTLPATLRDTD
jgi:hypothetical protein